MAEFRTLVKKIIKESGGSTRASRNANLWYKESIRTSTDFIAKTSEPFKPGKIYIFRYNDPKTPNLPWWDRNPISLSIGRNTLGNDVGINLNLLPPKAKSKLLDNVYEVYKTNIKKSIGASRGRNRTLNEKFLPLDYTKIKGYLKKFGFDFAVRSYIPGRKEQQRVISYVRWPFIDLMDLSDIANENIQVVYDEFYEYINK